MKKRLLSIVLVLCMVLALMPAALAADEVIEITNSEQLVAAIKEQKDGQTWVLAGGTYDVKNGDEGGYTLPEGVTLMGYNGPYVFPIYVNNLTIKAAADADVTITSSWDPNSGAKAQQNFITVGGTGVTITGVNLKSNKNGAYDDLCNKVIELVDGAKDFSLTDVKIEALVDQNGKRFGGAIYLSVTDAGETKIENVEMDGWVNAKTVTGGNVAISDLTIDFTDNFYAGYYSETYGYAWNPGVSGTAEGLTVEGLTIQVDDKTNLQKQVIDNLRDGTTIELTEDITVSAGDARAQTGAINIEGEKNITINGNGHTIFADAEDAGFANNIKVINIADGPNVTIKDLTVDGSGVAKHGIGVTTDPGYPDTALTLENVTSTNNKGYGLVNNASTATVAGLNTSNNGWGGVNVDSKAAEAIFEMTSGTIEEDNSVRIEGAEGGTTTTTITGGSFVTISEPEDVASTNTVEISGGTFKTEIPEEYFADGFAPSKDEDGNYTVQEPGKVTGVKVVDGDDGYTPVTVPTAGQKLLANIQTDKGEIGGWPVNPNAEYKWYTENNPDVVIGTEPYYTVTTEDLKETLCVEVGVYGYTGKATWKADDELTIPATGVTLNKKTTTIALGKTETLTATVTPDVTSDTLSWTTSNESVATVENGVVTAKGLGTATITVKVGEFTASCVVTVTCDEDNCPSKTAYTDVNTGDWYHAATDYVTVNGIMEGIGDKLFAPDMDLTRAQLVQILYNMEGKPAYTASKTFSDVTKKTDWYYNAIMWAASEGIVKGYEDGTFQPDRKISRQEMVTIMFNYGKDKLPVSGVDADALKDFPDADKTWAEDAFAWAVSYEIVNGKDGKLAPEDTARRAEAAKIIMVFCNETDFGA